MLDTLTPPALRLRAGPAPRSQPQPRPAAYALGGRFLPGGTVIARANAGIYKDHPADVREIRREQGVRYVLEGSVLLAGDRVRVNAQLVVADTGAHLWAERFGTPCHDVLQAHDTIVGRLACAVGMPMIDAQVQWAKQPASRASGSARW